MSGKYFLQLIENEVYIIYNQKVGKVNLISNLMR